MLKTKAWVSYLYLIVSEMLKTKAWVAYLYLIVPEMLGKGLSSLPASHSPWDVGQGPE